MRSLADPALAVLLVAALVGCAEPAPSPPSGTSAPRVTAPAESPASPSPATTPSAYASPTGIVLPEPGHPFDGASLLREMQDSRRPGGVPDEVQTPAVAEAIARTIWTFDGSSWDTIAISGFCGSVTCTVELAGARVGHAGEDLWILDVNPTTESVSVVASEVRVLPWDLVDELDAVARGADTAGDLEPMLLTTTRWIPPPDGDRFVLSYRTGGEEGSCAREIMIDAPRGTVIEATSRNC